MRLSKKIIFNRQRGKFLSDFHSLIYHAQLFNLSLDTILLEELTIAKDSTKNPFKLMLKLSNH